MRVGLFRLGIAFILLAFMFLLVEAVDKYIDTGTAAVMLILWLIGVFLVFVSAFLIPVRYSNKGVVPSS